MKEFIRKNFLLIIFATAGAIAGFLYWKYIGCLSGTCPIKSVWYLSTLYGGLLGFIAGSLIKDLVNSFKKKKNIPQNPLP